METSRVCKRCKEKRVIFDSLSGTYLCDACGVEQESDDNFQAQIGGLNGPTGTFFRISNAASSTAGEINGQKIYRGGVSNYREIKIFNAEKNIEEITSNIGLSAPRTAEVKRMIGEITKGEFGNGNWFPVLIGACSCVVMRKNRIPLTIAEVAAVIGCDLRVIGEMITRVTEFLDLRLPELDIASAFERAIKNSPCFSDIPRGKMDVMLRQGKFLLQCCIKWFLTTGRQPLPMVAAVLAFVSEVNRVRVTIEDVAKEIYAGINTSKLRYKELKECLVKVSRGLPWGKDVSVKNLVQNFPIILRYMEMKLEESRTKTSNSSNLNAIDLKDSVDRCLTKEFDYTEDDCSVGNDFQYFEAASKYGTSSASDADLEKLKLSQDCLSRMYGELLKKCDSVRSEGEGIPGAHQRKRQRRDEGLRRMGWWVGKLDLKKFSLEQILERSVGFDASPPSFEAGKEACKRRREKINAAKLRIDSIMHAKRAGYGAEDNACPQQQLQVRKSSKERDKGCDLDWEDNIIELLLLYQVNEEEIEQGHYNILLDLHVFNYLDTNKTSSVIGKAS